MDNPVQSEAIEAYIKHWAWTEGLGDEVVKAFSEAAELVDSQENEVVHRAEDTLTSLYFVARGRIQQTVMDMFGQEVLKRPMIRGAVIGLFSIARSDPTNATLVATEGVVETRPSACRHGGQARSGSPGANDPVCR